ncbi:FimV/HubP family polar landmark protein [Aurantivibrio plasticivorans]
MHLRKLTLAISTVGAMCASGAYGLGLGEITLNSALNEPLDAEIKLLQVRDLSESEIVVELADRSDFARAGVDRVFFLQGLEFDVDMDNPGGPVVHVTSDRPVQEPFLNFLVKTQWPSGRLLREYTVLLDLPVFDRAPSQPVQPAQTQRPVAQPAPAPEPVAPAQARPLPAPVQATREDVVEPTAANEPPRAAPEDDYVEEAPARTTVVQATPAQEPVRYGDDSYQVQANDTLWEIALRTRPSRSSSVQQTMLALQRLNPDAFINDNINLLKKGQVLRIPSQSDIDALSLSEAVSEVAYQNNQWRGSDSSVGAQLEGASTEISYDDEPSEQQGQLRIAAPSDSASAASQSGGGDSLNQEILENDLAINMEQLDSVRRENDELNERVSELDDQIDTIERLIEVSNAELSELQQGIAQTDAVEAVAQDEVADAAESDAESTAESATEDDQVAVEEAPVSKAPVIRAKPPEPSLVDTLMGYIWYVLAGIGVLVAIIAFVIFQRRTQREMEEFDSYDDTEFVDQEDSLDDDFGDLADTEFDTDEFDLATDELDEEEEPQEEQAAPVQSETGDAVAEADIYIAYGKFDQAEEMLVRALEDEPGNTEARLKLLEVYAETRDAEKFDAQYAQVVATGDASAEQKAADLRNTIPGIAAFVGGAAAVAAATDSDVEDLSGDLNFDDLDQIDEPEEESAPDEEADDFDFGDLDLDLDAGTESEPLDTAEPVSGVDTELDFDFDLGDENSDDTEASAEDDLSFDLDLDESGSSDADTDTLDFDLDLDSSEEPVAAEETKEDDLSFDFDLGESAEEAATDEDDLTLDLDGALDTDELSIEGFDTNEAPEGDGLELGVEADDLEIENDEAPIEFDAADLDLGDDSVDLDIAEDDSESASEEDDFLADLEFSPASDDDAEPQAETADSDDLSFDFASDESANALDDAFDLESGDVDLAALDQEMDALVGGLDDDDDLDLEVTPTEVVPKVSADDIGDKAALDGDASGGETATDLDDLISLDDTSLDDLALGDQDGAADDFSVDDLTFDSDDDSADDDMDSELDFLADTDEVATKLDLARAYIDMGDKDGARDILEEVSSEGNDEQKSEAQELLGRL